MGIFEGAWPTENEQVRRVRDALFGEPPASCREISLRLNIARPFVDAVFHAEIEQGGAPTPCNRCNGVGAVNTAVGGVAQCRGCRGSGIAS
jgi:DnaJ-class molecular chaperone